MSKQIFADGSVLTTGKDMIATMEAMFNRRDAHDISCSFCVHEGNEEYCEGCTIADTDHSCSCHICPPCSKCVGSKFEVSPFLINYEQHKEGRKRWQCFKGDESVFAKLEAIEKTGFHLSAEILSTGEAAIYIDDGSIDYEVEVCKRSEFKQKMRKMIMAFDVNTPKMFLDFSLKKRLGKGKL